MGKMADSDPHAKWRLAFARQIAERICAYKGIRAIVVGGSVARGYDDAYSDLEMPLFWDDLPSDEIRKAIVADLRSSNFTDTIRACIPLAVVAETLSLVEERYPQVDTSVAKKRLFVPRKVYRAPVILWR